MPLPSARLNVIPPGWSAHHRPVVDDAKTATCRIDRPAVGVAPWDPETGQVDPPTPQVIYEDQCRVQAQGTRQVQPVAADEAISDHTYLVTIHHDAPEIRAGEQGDVVTVTVCPDDPQLVDRVMRVMDVEFDSLLWERYLYCRDDLTANNPPRPD